MIFFFSKSSDYNFSIYTITTHCEKKLRWIFSLSIHHCYDRLSLEAALTFLVSELHTHHQNTYTQPQQVKTGAFNDFKFKFCFFFVRRKLLYNYDNININWNSTQYVSNLMEEESQGSVLHYFWRNSECWKQNGK